MSSKQTQTQDQNHIQHTSGGGGGDGVKLQFPILPKEWESRYVKDQMYRYQDSLPKLPVPPLKQTLQKYVASVEHLLTPEELERTKAAVAEFGKPGGDGEMLQERLLQRAEEKESWLFEWWNHVAYLSYRPTLVVNCNPACGFPRQPCGDTDTYISKAFSPDIYRKTPMCMALYDMFSHCRIPGPSVDSARRTLITDSRHIIVMRKGHFFKLDVMYECPDGTLAVAPASHVMEELHKILRMAAEPCEYPVGILTSEHRDTWYQARQRLIHDPLNKSSLDVIECAQFVLCLDEAHPHTKDLDPKSKYCDSHRTIIANRILHGGGCKQQSTNRWFDIALQFFVGEDGGVGSSLEHSASDGQCAIQVNIFPLDLQKIHDVLSEPSPVPTNILQLAEQLNWNISAETAKDINTAKKNLDSLIQDVDLQVTTFTEFGKGFPKSIKLSPDAFFQNAIQLTYYKLYNKTAATYESASTRKFKLGRTDTIRSNTNASHTFVKTMTDPNASIAEKASSLRNAVKAHTDYTMEAVSGQGIDRHLLGLSLLAREAGMEMPQIFKDPAFGKSFHFCLSTSQVPLDYNAFICFGAVVPDGYGVAYNPMESKTLLSVSSFRSCKKTDSLRFGDKLAESLLEMRDVMTAAMDSSSVKL